MAELKTNKWFYNSTENKLYILASESLLGPTCLDGTAYGKCSSNKPKYCDNGILIDKCSLCGCPSGQVCNATTETCYPAPYFADDFESGNFSAWTLTTGTPNIVTSPVHHGTYAMERRMNEFLTKDFATTYDELYVRTYFRYDTPLQANGERITVLYVGNTGYHVALVYVEYYNGAVRWSLRNMRTTSFWIRSSQQLPQPNTWYSVELYVKMSDGMDNGEFMVYVNGTELTDITRIGWNNTGTLNRLRLGQEDSRNDTLAWFDDVVVNGTYIGL